MIYAFIAGIAIAVAILWCYPAATDEDNKNAQADEAYRAWFILEDAERWWH